MRGVVEATHLRAGPPDETGAKAPTYVPGVTNPVFVVGHPRSGTTLIQLLLASADEVGTAPETHFYTYVDESAVSTIDPRLLGHASPGPTDDQPAVQVRLRLAAKPRIELSDREFRELALTVGTDWNDSGIVLDRLMAQLAQRSCPTAERWLEKTPRHVFALGRILSDFGGARVVNVVRDARDVCASGGAFSRLPPGERRLEYCLQRASVWSAAVQVPELDDARILTVRYEDFVAAPESTVEEMLVHTGIRAEGERLMRQFSSEYGNAVVAGEERRKSLLASGAIVDRRGRWQQLLTPDEASAIQQVAATPMADYGYG